MAFLAMSTSAVSLYFVMKSSELVYVDINKLMDEYRRTKKVKAEFQTKAKTFITV